MCMLLKLFNVFELLYIRAFIVLLSYEIAAFTKSVKPFFFSFFFKFVAVLSNQTNSFFVSLFNIEWLFFLDKINHYKKM